MPELIDIHDTVPADITNRLLTNEPVFYYSAGGGGCFGMGPKEWFALTNRRVLMTTAERGMFGFGGTTGVVKGCMSSAGAIEVTSTGATRNRAIVKDRQQADIGTTYVQQALQEFRQQQQQSGSPT